jgi:hypothetical protein
MMLKVPRNRDGSRNRTGVSADLLGPPDGPGEQRLSPVWRVREYSAVPIGSRRQASHPVENSCVLIMNGAWMASLPARAHATDLPAVWLRDCYADLDGVESAVAVAGREREKGKDRS